MKNLSLKRGFTLIELLVVIAIIGLLASTVLASLSGARGAARDTGRLAEGRELMKALEIYRAQNANEYPCSTGTSIVCSAGGTAGNAWLVRPASSAYTNMEPTLRTALKFLPANDVTGGYSLLYNVRSSSDPTAYTILVGLEDPVVTATASTTAITVSTVQMNYCRITSGIVDETSTVGGIAFKEIGRCPVSAIK